MRALRFRPGASRTEPNNSPHLWHFVPAEGPSTPSKAEFGSPWSKNHFPDAWQVPGTGLGVEKKLSGRRYLLIRSDWGNTTMPEWFDALAQELSLIGGAPISSAIALVVVIIVVWAILYWFYHRMLSSKDIQIEVLQSRLVDYRNVLEGASPREAAYKITQLKGKLESVRKHQAGLQSFRSMRRIEASRSNASALRLMFSQSLASLRQRLSQAKVRSTT